MTLVLRLRVLRVLGEEASRDGLVGGGSHRLHVARRPGARCGRTSRRALAVGLRAPCAFSIFVHVDFGRVFSIAVALAHPE